MLLSDMWQSDAPVSSVLVFFLFLNRQEKKNFKKSVVLADCNLVCWAVTGTLLLRGLVLGHFPCMELAGINVLHISVLSFSALRSSMSESPYAWLSHQCFCTSVISVLSHLYLSPKFFFWLRTCMFSVGAPLYTGAPLLCMGGSVIKYHVLAQSGHL